MIDSHMCLCACVQTVHMRLCKCRWSRAYIAHTQPCVPQNLVYACVLEQVQVLQGLHRTQSLVCACVLEQVQVLRGLHRTQNLAARAERALLSCQGVQVDSATLCSACRTPIGTHIFARCACIFTRCPMLCQVCALQVNAWSH